MPTPVIIAMTPTGGTITCTEFVDINGKRHKGVDTGNTAGVT